MVKNTTITKWAEGFEFATLGLHETAEEDSFLTKVSEYIAESSTITRVDAWKCIVKLRDLTKKPSAKESILYLVNPGQYPAEVAKFRDDNFNTLELGYKYIVSQGEIKPNTVSEQRGTDSSNTVKSESSQQAEIPEPTEDTEDQDSTEKVGNVTELEKWEYEIDQSKKIVTLLKYTSEQPDVIVYGRYESGGKIYKTHIDAENIFCGNTNIENVKINKINTENLSSTRGMFNGCKKLKSLDLGGLNTENVTDMASMF